MSPFVKMLGSWVAGLPEHVDAQVRSNVRLASVVGTLRMTDARLASIYDSEGIGGEKMMRAKVIRELVDEIRVLRRELAEARTQAPAPRRKT